MSRIWFTSDLHIGHKNVIEYANRPFTSVEEMDATIINNWNLFIAPEDTVYVLGDVVFLKLHEAVEKVSALNGHKHLIFGNHDKPLKKKQAFLGLFESSRDYAELKIADKDAKDGVQRIVLLHYAMKIWNKSQHGAWHLYGHSHGSLPDDPHALSLDVGVDAWDMKPVSYDQVKARMKEKTWVPVDHHRPRGGV